MMAEELNEETLQELYAWIDKIPLSRPKRNITRDFSDGVLAAEIVKHFYPKLVELHNYAPANSTQQKLSNWGTLNRKVFSKFNFHVPEDTVKRIVSSVSGCIEPVLCDLRERIEARRSTLSDSEKQELDYYTTTNGKQDAEIAQMPSMPVHMKSSLGKEKEQSSFYKARPGPVTIQKTDMDPTVRRLIEEKDQALLELQETVEVLQIKVSKLEHLVQLKDLHIDDLTRHIEKYKAKTKKH